MKKFDSINVIPFIDVVLVLLAIVLTTSTFIAKGIMPVNLPKSSAKGILDSKNIVITIKKEGDIFFEENKTDIQSLKMTLAKLDTQTHISINCDKSAKFNSFVEVLDSAKNLGFKHISIITEK